MTSYRITLNSPTPPLNANNRNHWAKNARITSALREEIGWKARAQTLHRHITAPFTVTLHYRPSDNRRRDTDNLTPTLKVCCDALVDAGLADDDTPDLMRKQMPIIHRAEKGKAGQLWIEIEPSRTQ